jgi:hypothetical protein
MDLSLLKVLNQVPACTGTAWCGVEQCCRRCQDFCQVVQVLLCKY